MAELRSFIFIDQLQPQTLCYISSWMRGSLPRRNMAAQIMRSRKVMLGPASSWLSGSLVIWRFIRTRLQK